MIYSGCTSSLCPNTLLSREANHNKNYSPSRTQNSKSSAWRCSLSSPLLMTSPYKLCRCRSCKSCTLPFHEAGYSSTCRRTTRTIAPWNSPLRRHYTRSLPPQRSSSSSAGSDTPKTLSCTSPSAARSFRSPFFNSSLRRTPPRKLSSSSYRSPSWSGHLAEPRGGGRNSCTEYVSSTGLECAEGTPALE